MTGVPYLSLSIWIPIFGGLLTLASGNDRRAGVARVIALITAITGWFAELLAGAFFVETIFGWKGIGKVTVDALEKLDFPVVMGSVLITSFFFIVTGLLSDVLYGLVDPRVRLAG